MRWPSLRFHREHVPALTRLLETHRDAYLAAVFTPGHEAEALYHACWVEAAEHGCTAAEASIYASEHLTGPT